MSKKHSLAAPLCVSDVVGRFGGVVTGPDAATLLISRVCALDAASVGDIAPFLTRRYAKVAEQASARGAVILARDDLEAAFTASPTGVVVRHRHPLWVLAHLLDSVEVSEPPVVVGEGSVIAATATLLPGVVVGRNVRIGPGSVIGAPGFGFATGPGGASRHVPQLGGVVIEDDVWIGALVTVDGGTLSPTYVRRGARIDAHVHVGHNVDVGAAAILCAQTGLAGSVHIGAGAVLGGQVGVADHVRIGRGAKIAAKSGVIGDVPEFAVYGGYPAQPRLRWLRGLARLYRGSAF